MFFIFIIIFTSISDCFTLFFSFFPGTGNIKSYLVIIIFFCFICLCNEHYHRKKKKKSRDGGTGLEGVQGHTPPPSPLLKCCHQGQIVTVLSILERLEFKNFSCQPTMVVDIPFQCSMGPPLWNSFRRPWNPLLTQLCNLSQNYATLCPKQLCLMIDSLKILKCSMMGYNS